MRTCLTTECASLGEEVVLVAVEVKRRPYMLSLTCPGCGESWKETGTPEEVKALLATTEGCNK